MDVTDDHLDLLEEVADAADADDDAEGLPCGELDDVDWALVEDLVDLGLLNEVEDDDEFVTISDAGVRTLEEDVGD